MTTVGIDIYFGLLASRKRILCLITMSGADIHPHRLIEAVQNFCDFILELPILKPEELQ